MLLWIFPQFPTCHCEEAPQALTKQSIFRLLRSLSLARNDTSKIRFWILAVVVFLFCAAQTTSSAQELKDLDNFTASDRVLILAPHPDDEAIACAGVIMHALKAGAQVNVAYLTNGDHNEIAFIVYEKRLILRQNEFIHMGEVRKEEAIKAMQLLGLSPSQLTFLGYPDFGTFSIFSSYWQSKKPYRSLLTRISSVPYKDDLSYDAPYVGESILSDISRVLLAFKPNKIFVSHPADVNVDHKSLYLFLQIVLADLKGQIPDVRIFPYLVHHVGWPLPRHYHPELPLEPPDKLVGPDISWHTSKLTPEEIESKHRAILCYRSQTNSSAFYLLSFARGNELFSDFLAVDLKSQASFKGSVVQFTGFSDVFADTELSGTERIGHYAEATGQVSYAVVDDSLVVRLEKKENITRKFHLILYLFGYSNKKPFAQMPKLQVVIHGTQFRILDKEKVAGDQGASLQYNAKQMVFKIPFKLIGDPDFILASLRKFGKSLPFDAIGFRKLRIR